MSNEYDFYSGQYPYPLNKVLTDGGDFCKPFIAGDPTNVNPGVDNFYVICCTPDQMSKIQSSLEVGAPIAYPDFYNDVFQLVDQATQYPNSFEGSPCVDLCELIIECIENTPELQQLIAGTALGSSINADTTVNDSIANSSVLIENVGCDLDNLFGMTTGIVDLYNNLAQDIIEKLNAAANTMARLGDAIEAIPGIGSLPVDDALQFTESFLEDISQNYDSSYTVALRDEYRCDLFCLAKEECELTFTQIFDYFNGRMVESIVLVDWQDLAEYMTEGTFSGEELVHAFHAFVAGIFMLGGDILGIDSGKLTNMVSALFNDPDGDWETLCTECPEEWTHIFDFVTDNTPQGWTPYAGRGVLVAGGWQYGTLTSNVQIQRTFAESNITQVLMFNSGLPVGSCGDKYQIRLPDVGGSQFSYAGDNNGADMDVTSTGIWVDLCTDNSTAIRIEQIHISGTGVNPFI